jgi:predicted ferric reductase
MLGAAAAGALAAVLVLPAWFPGLSASLLGPEPKAYWYLARSSAFVAFGLLWLSMLLGLSITTKLSRLWPGAPTTYELHQYSSLLGLAFALFHGLILLGDRYLEFTPLAVLLPFGSRAYRPLGVGLGPVAFYVALVVGLSFYGRQRIGRRAWRLLHFASFASFALALAHGVTSGTDTGSGWAQAIYWLAGGSVLFLTNYRLIAAWQARHAPVGRRVSAHPGAPRPAQPARPPAGPPVRPAAVV